MKIWLIETMAPFCGTSQYYAVYSNEDPIDWLYENWFSEECQNLWDSYSFYNYDQYQDEWENLPEDEKEEVYENDYDLFLDAKYDDWCADCSMTTKEVEEEELDDYVPGGEGHLEIVYDERK